MAGVVVVWIALILAVLLLLISAAFPRENEVAGGEVVYSDLVMRGKTLYSRTLGLSGKPDYIIRKGQTLIPVEVKSTKAPNRPYRGHVLQLAAYCFLIEENFGVKVPYGYLVYGDGKRFVIDYNDALKAELILTVADMREALKMGGVRYRRDPKRCESCNLREFCPEFS